MRPPDKRNPGLALAAKRGAEIDRAEQPIFPRHSRPHCDNQAIAIPRKFGFCYAVYVRRAGIAHRLGLYSDTGAVVSAARNLNEIFQDAAP